jgi:hypothetical protein
MSARPFISYAREDCDVAVRLRDDLVRLGATPWIDVSDLIAGQDWQLAISRALRESSHFLALLSHHSVTKRGYVQKEVREALDLLEQFPPDAVFIIPVRLDDSEPSHDRLRNLHWVDLFAGYDKAVAQIARGLGLVSQPTSRPVRVAPRDVPAGVMQTITSRAEHDFPQNLSIRRYQINREVEAWREFQTFDPPDVPPDVMSIIIERATTDFPDNFSTRLYQANREVDSWRQLQSFSPPDVPLDQLRMIIRAAESDFPTNFSTRLYQMNREVESWRQLYG